jgi:hypothetical protein
VLASLSSRYGNQLCTNLVWRRWAVEVDAEVGQRITFGRQVLAKRMAAGWDAAVVMLGNNYDGDPQAFKAELDALLDELGPIPIVLVTVTRFRPEQDQVNYILTTTANERPNVQLLDWQERTAQPDADTLLGGDGLHLSDEGRVMLANLLTNTLGTAPRGQVGKCLPSSFTDDSQGSVTGGTSGSQSSPSSAGRTSTTRPHHATTTTPPRRRKGS